MKKQAGGSHPSTDATEYLAMLRGEPLNDDENGQEDEPNTVDTEIG